MPASPGRRTPTGVPHAHLQLVDPLVREPGARQADRRPERAAQDQVRLTVAPRILLVDYHILSMR